MEHGSTINANDVILRPYRLDDLDAIYELTQETAVREFLPDWNVPKSQRREWLMQYEMPENERFLAAVAAGGEIGEIRLRLVITLRQTGQFVGWCCTGIKEELPTPNREVVFAVGERFRKHGYASQAVCALVEYLFSKTDAVVVNAVASDRNVASNKVMQKSGFSYVGAVDIEGEQHHHYQSMRQISWGD